jgi:hypothetical protein
VRIKVADGIASAAERKRYGVDWNQFQQRIVMRGKIMPTKNGVVAAPEGRLWRPAADVAGKR